MVRTILTILLIATLSSPAVGWSADLALRVAGDESRNVDVEALWESTGCHELPGLWVVSTRCLPAQAGFAATESPNLAVSRVDRLGNRASVSLDDFLGLLGPERPVIVHIHGNRLTEAEAIARGRFVQGKLANYQPLGATEFVIFSWPSEQTTGFVKDGRNKARMTDAEGLYLGWLLRELIRREVPVGLIGYSFGCRITTGALHALAGGRLAGCGLPDEPIRGARIPVALIAPAIDACWLMPNGYHGLAAQNISRMVMLYNSRDAVLKRHWLVEPGIHSQALGYVGMRYAPRGYADQPVPVTVRDCTRTLGIAHSEVQYYAAGCGGAALIAGLMTPELIAPELIARGMLPYSESSSQE